MEHPVSICFRQTEQEAGRAQDLGPNQNNLMLQTVSLMLPADD